MPVGDMPRICPKEQVFQIDSDLCCSCCSCQHRKSEGKHGRKEDAYGSIRAEARTSANDPDQHGNGDPRWNGGYGRVEADYEPKHHSRQHGVGEGVPHEGEVPGDDVRADQRTHHAHKHRADQGSHHEAVLEWGDKEIYHVVLLPLPVHREAQTVSAVQLLHDLGGKHLVRRAAGAHVAVQAQYLVESTSQVGQVVGRQQDDAPLIPQCLQDLYEAFLGARVNPAEGLIQQENACLLGQRPCDENPLPLPSRKLRHESRAMVPQAHTAQARVDKFAVSLAGPAEPSQSAAPAHHHNVRHGHGKPPVDALPLRHVGQRSASLVHTVKSYLPPADRKESGNSIE